VYSERQVTSTPISELHELLDRIPADRVPAARRFLESLLDPVERALLHAPLDDEPETPEEHAAVKAALTDPAADVPFEQVRRRT
jgi:hypothetical protein